MKVMKLVFTVLLAAATAVVAAKEDVVDDRVDAQVVAAGEIDLDSSIVVDNQNQRQEQNVDDVEVDGAAGVGDAEVAPENTAPVVTTTVPVSSTKSDTCGFKHRFDRFRHQNVYVVGVHATHSFESTIKEYGVIFGDYLTATVGQRFDPPISFEVVPYTFDGIFEAIDNENIDFMFTSPSIYSCIGIEVGAAALGTVVNHAVIRDDIYDLDVYAGVMITQAENNNIETIADLKDKIIGSNTISDLMGGQLQFYEMEREGLSYVNDPKQVVFTYDQAEVVRGVLNGDFDVGFVRTDQVEHTTITHDSTTLVDPEEFKVISPRVDLMDNGNYFPFLHTTEVFPEWPLSMLTHVPQDVADEVEMALRNIHVHAELGRKYQASPNGDFPYDYATVEELNALPCDVSKEVAQFAAQGAHDAEIYGFRPPRSYFKLRSMQQDGGFLAKDEAGEWYCIRPSNFYDVSFLLICFVVVYSKPVGYALFNVTFGLNDSLLLDLDFYRVSVVLKVSSSEVLKNLNWVVRMRVFPVKKAMIAFAIHVSGPTKWTSTHLRKVTLTSILNTISVKNVLDVKRWKFVLTSNKPRSLPYGCSTISTDIILK